MRQEAHDCLGHAAVGGVVEGVVALSEVVPRRAACAILVHRTDYLTCYTHLVRPDNILLNLEYFVFWNNTLWFSGTVT